jgi:uncharacterized cofD-like protein
MPKRSADPGTGQRLAGPSPHSAHQRHFHPDVLRVVAIGGGTGLSALLRGLKAFVPLHTHDIEPLAGGPYVDITAVVTVTDDGGSSGRLRRELGTLPPGDIRNCMVALSEDEALLSQLFQYRFESGRGLKGHSFGNLFLSAMTHLTGDFAKAIAFSSEVLASRGRIFPSTSEHVTLTAVLENGAHVAGETKISRSTSRIVRIGMDPPRPQPLQESIDAILAADLVCLGPGSLYTSVIPNVLVSGIPAALKLSPARVVYFPNLMWQPGETVGYAASDHVQAIHDHAGEPIVDCVVLNSTPISGSMRRRYASEQLFPVANDVPKLAAMGVEAIGRRLLDSGEKVRHSPTATAEAVMELAVRARRETTLK